jgi:hypothetical protein
MDERTRYFRRLKRLRGSARRWSVVGGGLSAAAVVLTPYAGIGLADAFWAAGAGASVMLAYWRHRDHRELAAIPPPPAPPPALPGAKLMSVVERFPAGRTMIQEVRRQKDRYALRGSAVARAWDRLDRASQTLQGLSGRLAGPGEEAVLEAATAEHWLRDLGQRVASVEKAIPLSPADQRPALETSHESLANQFTEGVTAYERLVAAAASWVAEDGQPIADERHPSFFRLIEATDRLRGLADGLSELRKLGTPSTYPAATDPWHPAA